MHTVRNRLASRPPTSTSFPAGRMPPGRHDAGFVPRGSMAIPLGVPEESGLVETRAQRRRNPKGKKARKAAARLAAVCEVQAQLDESPEAKCAPPPRHRGKKQGKSGKVRASVPAAPAAAAPAMPPPVPSSLPAEPALLLLEADPLLDQCLAAEPALALTLPVRPEPLVLPELPPEPLTAPRVLSFDAMPELIAADADPQAFILLPEAEPLVEMPAMPIEPDAVPEPAIALAALADAPMPLPRAVALVPARRQGLVDVIAFLLRDSGRRLARWSARQINLQRELEALDALRRSRG